jgi:hypothetical protein
MKTNIHRAILLALSLTLAATAACAADDEPTTDLQEYQAVEQMAEGTGSTITRLFDPEGADPVDVEGGMCACATPECMDQFVLDNWGCGLCVDVECGDGSHAGGCVMCD